MHEMQCLLQDLSTTLHELINEYGEVVAIHKDELYQDDIIHDFLFFCITKGTKSIQAS